MSDQRNSRSRISTAIYRNNKYLRIHLQNALREYDITPDQWVVLGKVYYDSGVYNQKAIAEICFKERAAITRILDVMERKGLLERRNSLEDRREYLIYITEHGKEIYEKTLKPTAESEELILNILKKEEVEELLRLLAKLENGLK